MSSRPASRTSRAERRHIEQAALVGPAPVRVALEVRVLQMKRADRPAQSVQPFRHVGFGTVERLIQGVADIDQQRDRNFAAALEIFEEFLRLLDGVRNFARERRAFDLQPLEAGRFRGASSARRRSREGRGSARRAAWDRWRRRRSCRRADRPKPWRRPRQRRRRRASTIRATRGVRPRPDAAGRRSSNSRGR